MLDISYNDLDGVPRFNGKGKDFYLHFKGIFIIQVTNMFFEIFSK